MLLCSKQWSCQETAYRMGAMFCKELMSILHKEQGKREDWATRKTTQSIVSWWNQQFTKQGRQTAIKHRIKNANCTKLSEKCKLKSPWSYSVGVTVIGKAMDAGEVTEKGPPLTHASGNENRSNLYWNKQGGFSENYNPLPYNPLYHSWVFIPKTLSRQITQTFAHQCLLHQCI